MSWQYQPLEEAAQLQSGPPSWTVVGSVSFELLPGASVEGPPKPMRLMERGVILIERSGPVYISEHGTRVNADGYIDETGVETNYQPVSNVWIVDGAVSFSLTPGATATPEWVVSANVSVSFLPGSAITRDWALTGSVIATLTPGATVSFEVLSMTGNVIASLTPGATVQPQYVLTGGILATLLPGATVAPEWVVMGAVLCTFMPGSQSYPQYVLTGNVLTEFMPGATVLREWALIGSVLASLTPGAATIADYVTTGNVLMSLLPGATASWEKEVQGNILLTFMPGSSIFREWALIGSLVFEFAPSEDFVFDPGGMTVMGNVVMSLTPGATAFPEFAFTGNALVEFVPNAQIARDWPVLGNVVMELIPGAILSRDWALVGDLLFTLINSAEVVTTGQPIQGDVLFSLFPSSEIVFVPPQFFYEWAIQKKFSRPEGMFDSQLMKNRRSAGPGEAFLNQVTGNASFSMNPASEFEFVTPPDPWAYFVTPSGGEITYNEIKHHIEWTDGIIGPPSLVNIKLIQNGTPVATIASNVPFGDYQHDGWKPLTLSPGEYKIRLEDADAILPNLDSNAFEVLAWEPPEYPFPVYYGKDIGAPSIICTSLAAELMPPPPGSLTIYYPDFVVDITVHPGALQFALKENIEGEPGESDWKDDPSEISKSFINSQGFHAMDVWVRYPNASSFWLYGLPGKDFSEPTLEIRGNLL